MVISDLSQCCRIHNYIFSICYKYVCAFVVVVFSSLYLAVLDGLVYLAYRY